MTIEEMLAASAARGAAAVRSANVVLYGTRPTPQRSAADAPNRTAPCGAVGKYSVYNGPQKAPRGRPVLKEVKQA